MFDLLLKEEVLVETFDSHSKFINIACKYTISLRKDSRFAFQKICPVEKQMQQQQTSLLEKGMPKDTILRPLWVNGIFTRIYIYTFESKTIRKHEDLKYAWYKIESSTYRYKFQNLRFEQFHTPSVPLCLSCLKS